MWVQKIKLPKFIININKNEWIGWCLVNVFKKMNTKSSFLNPKGH